MKDIYNIHNSPLQCLPFPSDEFRYASILKTHEKDQPKTILVAFPST